MSTFHGDWYPSYYGRADGADRYPDGAWSCGDCAPDHEDASPVGDADATRDALYEDLETSYESEGYGDLPCADCGLPIVECER